MDKAFSFKDVQIDMSDIPSYASLDEAVLYVAEANEILFNNLKREIGLNELGVFETTGNTISYVVEAEGEKESLGNKAKAAGKAVINKGGELKDKLLKLIDAVAGKIKGLFEAAMRKISELTAEAANAFGGKLDEGKLIAALDKTEIKFTSGDFENLEQFVSSSGELYIVVFGSAPEKDIKGDIADIIGGDLNKENLNKFFEGESKEQKLDAAGVKHICSLIKDFKGNNAAIKKMYKDSAKIINDKKKEVKSAKEVDNNLLNAVKANMMAMTLVYGTALSCYYKLIRQDVALAIKLAGKASKLGKAAEAGAGKVTDAAKAAKEAPGKAVDAVKEKLGKKDEKVKEAAVVEESAVEEEPATKTYTEEVESLFNWSF